MSEEKTDKKPRNKKDPSLVENGIYQVGPNLYDVKVRKRIKEDPKGAGVQHTKAKRNVRFLTEARKIRNQFVHELELKEQEHLNGDYTWKEAKEKYFEERYKQVSQDQTLKEKIGDKTFSNQKVTVEKHTETWDSMRLSDFKQEFIRNDLAEKLRGYPKSTVKSILKHIRAVFEYHYNKQITPLTHNPCKGIHPWGADNREQVDDIPKMSMDEVSKLLTHTAATNSEWHSIFYCAYHTGMRSGELWAWKWEDIDADFKIIRLRRSYCFQSKKEKTPKNKHARSIPINKSLRRHLMNLKIQADSSYVLPHLPMWRDGKIAIVLRGFQKELKITETSFHSIRASHITHMLLKGISSQALQETVGHADYRTMARYVRDLDRERAIKNITDVLDDDIEAKIIPFNPKKEDVG
jgi:integrase